MEAIYERPGDYELEHEGDDGDVRFYLDLVNKLGRTACHENASAATSLFAFDARIE